MKYLVYLLLLIVLTGLSMGLAPVVHVFGQVPQLLFLLVLVWSLEKQDSDFLVMALAAGVFMDTSAGNVIGMFTVPLLLLALMVHLVVENFLALELAGKNMLWLVLPAQAVFYFLYYATAWLMLKLRFPVQVPDAGVLLRTFAAAGAYNLFLVYPVSLLLGIVKEFVRKHIEREYKIR